MKRTLLLLSMTINLEGFPSVILAERDGSYEYRSDFIDVDVYEHELLKRINNK